MRCKQPAYSKLSLLFGLIDSKLAKYSQEHSDIAVPLSTGSIATCDCPLDAEITHRVALANSAFQQLNQANNWSSRASTLSVETESFQCIYMYKFKSTTCTHSRQKRLATEVQFNELVQYFLRYTHSPCSIDTS